MHDTPKQANHPDPTSSATDDVANPQGVILEVVTELARELNPDRAAPAIAPQSSLEADAGLDSLGRTELLRRLEQRFQVRLSEDDVFAAERVEDLLTALSQVCPLPEPPQQPTAESVVRDSRVPTHATTLVDALEWHYRTHPELEHIHLLEGDGEQPTAMSYADLWINANRVAGGLRDRALEPGQSVALMLPTSVEFFYAFAGTLLAGGVPVPIYPPARLAQIEEHLQRQAGILENAEAAFLVTVEQAHAVGRFLKSRLPQLRGVLTTTELLQAQPGARVPARPQDLALMQYTSGSTGNPKGVELSHANLLANIRAMGSALQVTETDVFVSWLPLYHDMGLIGAWLGTLYYGVPLVLMSPLAFIARPQRWLWAIHRFRGTLSAAPNFAYELCQRKIADSDLEGLDLSSLRFTCNGAEPVSAETLTRFIERFQPYGFRAEALAPVYGLAECSVGLAFPPLGRGPRIDYIDPDTFRMRSVAQPLATDTPGALHMVGCGFPLPDHELRVVDATGRELGKRRVGRLQFRGPSATRGYHRNPQATAELRRNGWLDSGDYAYLADGEVFIAGRAKDLIIRAGRNIYPYDLEKAIGDFPGIRPGGVAVFGTHDATGGNERLVVVAETRQRDPAKREQLRRDIERLTSDLVQVPPDDVVLAPPRAVLKTSSGKIRRSACRDLYLRGRIGQRRSLWSQFAHLAVTAAAPLVKRLWIDLIGHLYAAYAWVLFGLATVIVWPLVIILPGRRLPHAILRAAIYTLAIASGMRLRVHGRENLPRGRSCIVAANHASYLDGLVLSAALPHGYNFVAKRELGRNRFLRPFLAKAGTWFVDRVHPRRGTEDIQRLIEATRGGQSLVFFPEGTFTRAPGLRSFRLGAFVTAARSHLPILPVAIRGTRTVLRGDGWFPRRGVIDISFLPLTAPDGDDWQAALSLRERTRAAILAACGEPDLRAQALPVTPPGASAES